MAGQKLKLSLTAGQNLKDRLSVINIIKINVWIEVHNDTVVSKIRSRCHQ